MARSSGRPRSRKASAPISAQSAFLVSDILAGNTDPRQNDIWAEKLALRNGPGGSRRPAAAKTGTTNDARDLGTYGFLPASGKDGVGLAVGIWMGNSDHSFPNSSKPATSLTAAAPLWRAFVRDYTKGWKVAKFSRPKDVVSATIDAWSGGRPGGWTRDTTKEWFIKGTQPGARKAIDKDGLLYRQACGGWRVDPVKAELGPVAWKSDVQDWLRRARRGVGVSGRYDSATAYFWKESSWGGPLYGSCYRPKPPPEKKDKGDEKPKKDKGPGEAARRRSRRRPRRRPPAVDTPLSSAPRSGHMRSDITLWIMRGMGLAIGVLVVVGLVQLGFAAGHVLLLLFLSILLASALEPMIGWLREHLPLSRVGTILVVYVAFFIVMVGMAFIVVPAAFNQGQKILASLPPVVEEVKAWAATLRPVALSTSITALVDSAAEIIIPPPAAPPSPTAVVKVGTAVAEGALFLFTMLAIVFFWLVEHARLQRYTLAFLPAERRAGARHAWNEIETRLGLWVRGQLILMGAMGVATGTAYTLLGLPGALLLGLIAALTEAIPIVGPLLGAIPAILVAATVSPELALVVALIYIVLQLIEGNVLVPLVMRNTIGISPLLVLFSLLLGAEVGGLLGAFLAVPIAASVEIVLSRLQARETPVAQDPAAIESPDEETTDGYKRTLPDAANASTK